MKRIVALFVFLSLASMNGCTSQTTSEPWHYRYIVFDEVVYMEDEPGFFRYQNETILITVLPDRTEYRPTFSEAVVTVFSDGSLIAVYADDWTAECAAGVLADACVPTAVDAIRQAELTSLLGFRDASVQEGGYTPDADDPAAVSMAARAAIVITFLTLLFVYRLIVIILPHGFRGLIPASPSAAIDEGIKTARLKASVRASWVRHAAAPGEIQSEFDPAAGPVFGSRIPDPPMPFKERVRSQRLAILITLAVIALGIWWMITW